MLVYVNFKSEKSKIYVKYFLNFLILLEHTFLLTTRFTRFRFHSIATFYYKNDSYLQKDSDKDVAVKKLVWRSRNHQTKTLFPHLSLNSPTVIKIMSIIHQISPIPVAFKRIIKIPVQNFPV